MISRFLEAFLKQILELYATFSHFLHYMGLLGHLRRFVTNLICHNLRTFRVKYFWMKLCLCKKKLSFCTSGFDKLLKTEA